MMVEQDYKVIQVQLMEEEVEVHQALVLLLPQLQV
tara:strand:+ start:382 stop:486 length:105 start_codon:yes stop_codon:yes gene_type:complete